MKKNKNKNENEKKGGGGSKGREGAKNRDNPPTLYWEKNQGCKKKKKKKEAPANVKAMREKLSLILVPAAAERRVDWLPGSFSCGRGSASGGKEMKIRYVFILLIIIVLAPV